MKEKEESKTNSLYNELKTKIEQENIVKYYHSVPVKVLGVIIELTVDKKKVKRIKLNTDLGRITYKPRNDVVENRKYEGFDTEVSNKELLTVDEFIDKNPMLKLLSNNSTKAPQEIILSYCEMETIDNKGETVYYKYMNKKLFETIYYSEFHKEDKKNLDSMKALKEKYN